MFELAYPSPLDRRQYIRSIVHQGAPSRGHFAMAGLMTASCVPVVWTTNFDDMVEKACVAITGNPSFLTTLNLNDSNDAMPALNQSVTPLQLKLHGDYRVGSLMNVAEELRQQNSQMGYALIEGCQRYGLCIAGYSGRDDSVMSALHDALKSEHSFPGGIFWFVRPSSHVQQPVESFIEAAREQGIQAEIVEVESFDELMQSILLATEGIDQEVQTKLRPLISWVSDVEIPALGADFPLLRLNAFPVVRYPSSCRLIVCDFAGGSREVRQLVERSELDLVAGRTRRGIIAFGQDDELSTVFGHLTNFSLETYIIEPRKLRHESQEQGLMNESLARSLSQRSGAQLIRKRSRRFLYVPLNSAQDTRFTPVSEAINGPIAGLVSGTRVPWAEACEIRTSYTDRGLWLHLSPTVITLEGDREPETRRSIQAFRKYRMDRRYNHDHVRLLNAWLKVIGDGTIEQFASDMVDSSQRVVASFTVCPISINSRRLT